MKYPHATFPQHATCVNDGTILVLGTAAAPLAFPRATVTGIPVLTCPRCGASLYDIELLARIETLLSKRKHEVKGVPFTRLLRRKLLHLYRPFVPARKAETDAP